MWNINTGKKVNISLSPNNIIVRSLFISSSRVEHNTMAWRSSVTLAVMIVVLSISAAHSQKCSSQTLKSKIKFESCVDLPTLKSSLHYTYNATNSSMSVAFVAAPAKPEGWIAWAINPTAQLMAGAQALLAFKSNNKVIVKTYDVVSYSNVTESKLSFETWDLSGEALGDGNLVIYGSMKVPDNVDNLNQVWQVGGEVADGKPKKHEFQQDNLKSTAKLDLLKSTSTSPAPSPAPSSSPAAAAGGGGSSSPSLKISPLLSVFVLLITSVFFSMM